MGKGCGGKGSKGSTKTHKTSAEDQGTFDGGAALAIAEKVGVHSSVVCVGTENSAGSLKVGSYMKKMRVGGRAGWA